VDLEGYTIGAVIDPWCDYNGSVRHKIGLAPTSRYFNSGVLVVDLSRWRNAQVGERALQFAISHSKLITWGDQDAINHVVNGQFKQLSNKWNFQTGHLKSHTDTCKRLKLSSQRLLELRNAKIIHFTGVDKPWNYLSYHPMRWLYWKYLRKTQWRDYQPRDRTASNIIRKNLELRAPVIANLIRQFRAWMRT
jgi:lipopolysaccharide biosynthesis glycosyltransferase